MENASKALLIACGVFVAIIIISVGVTLYALYSNHAKEYKKIMMDTEIEKFNSKFNAYIGRTDITPQEMVTIINLAAENSITLNGISSSSSSEQFLKNNADKVFKCNGCTYDENGKIVAISFK